MKKRMIILSSTLLMLLLLLTSCMGAPKYSVGNESPYDYAAEAPEAGDVSYSNYVAYTNEADSGRFVIANARLTLQTKEYDELNKSISAKLKSLKGYVESRDEDNWESGRYQSLVVRVPNDKLEDFLTGLDEKATIISSNVTYTDVTNEMIETGSRRKALEAEEASLLEILKKAKTIDEIITVQDRLSNIKAELEGYILKLQKLENQVSYSTVNMSISEVERIKVSTQSFISLAGTGFMDSLKNLGNGLRAFVIYIVTALPYLALIAVIAVPVVIIVKRRRKKAN